MKTEDVLKAATPRPWDKGTPNDEASSKVGIWAEGANGMEWVLADMCSDTHEDQTANAALIVLAVNSHERQQECIAQLVAFARHKEGCTFKESLCSQPDCGEWHTTPCNCGMNAALTRAEELLGDEKQDLADQPSHTEGHIDCPACDRNRWELLRKERAKGC